MHFSESDVALPVHANIWQQFELSRSKGRLGQALLLAGSPPMELTQLAFRMAAAILCRQERSPCGACQSCLLAEKNEHPDFHYLMPEKEGSVIKIEQIRQLQLNTMTSPQLGHQRVIVINPADRMNTAAANALLKILEEPSDNTRFLLLAEQISTIPATIISRCQLWRSVSRARLQDDYLTQQSLYAPDSARGIVLAAANTIMGQLKDLHEGRQDPHALAQTWSQYPFAELIWLLYLLHAQLIQIALDSATDHATGMEPLRLLAKAVKPYHLYARLDKINEITAKLNHTVSINQLLALEDLLLAWQPVGRRKH